MQNNSLSFIAGLPGTSSRQTSPMGLLSKSKKSNNNDYITARSALQFTFWNHGTIKINGKLKYSGNMDEVSLFV